MDPHITCNGRFRSDKSQCSTYVNSTVRALVNANLTLSKQRKGYMDDFISFNIIIIYIFMIWDGRRKEIC